ncbi:MAG: hypothetical protein HY326_09250 [Chloroflexi bacterium]|nr:hypothetical protein [Chloroflexota bacterium]
MFLDTYYAREQLANDKQAEIARATEIARMLHPARISEGEGSSGKSGIITRLWQAVRQLQGFWPRPHSAPAESHSANT